MANKLGGAIQGNFPSAMNNILSFNPIQLSKVYAQEPQGDYIPEKCPYEDKEHFFNYKPNVLNSRNSLGLLFFVLLCGFAILMWISRKK